TQESHFRINHKLRFEIVPTKKLKILLFKVPEIDFTEKEISYSEVLSVPVPPIPLGVASLSAYLKKNTDHAIHLCDIYRDGYEGYLSSHSNDGFLELIQDRIREIQPDVIGISSLMIINYGWVHYVTKLAKEINSKVVTIVGGGYAGLLPEIVMQDDNVDFIVAGEGERTLLKILQADFSKDKLADVPGVGFRSDQNELHLNRELQFIEDMDIIPFFDWKGIRLERYLQYTNGSVSYITSRGCPFGCSFCSTHLMWGRKFRPLPASRVLDEIDYLVSEYSVRNIEFRDDNLTLDKDRAVTIFQGLIERGYDLTWTCPNALAVITLDQGVLELIKKSGCELFVIAIESGSERVIKDIIQKPISKEKVREVVRIAKEIGLLVHTAYIIGFPGETLDDIEQTRDFILELECDWNQISIATPLPGTEMHRVCEENDYFVNAEMDLERFRYGVANIRTDQFDERWIKTKAYDINIEANFIKNHNFKENPLLAVKKFRERLASYPKHLIALFCLAYAYKLSGDGANAQATLVQAFELIAEEPEIYQTYKKYIDPSHPIFVDSYQKAADLGLAGNELAN
ncbi:MAG: radical SAM protein, partial [Desulfobulbaceae bacterium]|nr:radical SAM protein [Desulfobulbaceae bacterium]